MSSGPNMPKPQSISTTEGAASAMENFVRLRDAQDEFLKWLESGEKSKKVDRYVYRKIR